MKLSRLWKWEGLQTGTKRWYAVFLPGVNSPIIIIFFCFSLSYLWFIIEKRKGWEANSHSGKRFFIEFRNGRVMKKEGVRKKTIEVKRKMCCKQLLFVLFVNIHQWKGYPSHIPLHQLLFTVLYMFFFLFLFYYFFFT